MRSVTRDAVTRHTLFAHAPAALTWRVGVPDGGRLDLGARLPAGRGRRLPRERRPRRRRDASRCSTRRVDDGGAWQQRLASTSSRWAGRRSSSRSRPRASAAGRGGALGRADRLGRAARAQRPERHLLRHRRRRRRPDEPLRLQPPHDAVPRAARGARASCFERAYSNSTWTQPSTASFMTSLHHSVLGGLRRGIHSTPVPAAAVDHGRAHAPRRLPDGRLHLEPQLRRA